MENYFAANLRYLRLKNGLRQAEMQQQLGVTRTTWSNYETGNTNPRIDDLINFARFFGITLDELLVINLSERDPLPDKNSRKKKPVAYKTNNYISVLAEDDIHYIKEEIKKLREEVNDMKTKKKK